MTILGTLEQYKGRAVDFNALTDTPGRTDGFSQQQLVTAENPGQLITGIRKLFQRFLVELLTEVSSLSYLPQRGTLFITQIRYGAIRTTQDLYAEFVNAEMIIRNNLQLEELITDPPDERYRTAQLLSASLTADHVNLTIQVTSVAGESLTVIHPLQVNTT